MPRTDRPPSGRSELGLLLAHTLWATLWWAAALEALWSIAQVLLPR